MNKPNFNGRVIRCLLLLREFDLTILDKPSKHNVVVYFLSILTHTTNQEIVDDAFLDEIFFSILVQTLRFADMKTIWPLKSSLNNLAIKSIVKSLVKVPLIHGSKVIC